MDAKPPIIISCAACHAELSVPDDVNWLNCRQCGQRIDVLAHVAFEWGQETFVEARERAIARRALPRGRRWMWRALDPEVMLMFEQAYSAVREGLRGELCDAQRKAGIEILSETTTLFASHLMTSGVESSYWGRLLREQIGIDERAALRQRIASSPRSLLCPLWRWRVRRLTRSLTKLGREVDQLEALMDVAEPLHARLPAHRRV